MNDPTGFYQVFGVAFVAWIAVLCVWYGVRDGLRWARSRRLERELRTPKPVQDWLHWWWEEGRYR